MTNLSNIVEILAQQALGGQQQSGQSGLGGILGSVLGQVAGGQQQSQGGLGGILGSVLGGLGGGQQQAPQSSGFNASSLLIAVVPLVLGWIQQNGGLQGALAKLQGAGLGGQVQSWVDPNQSNTEAATSQIQSLFNTQEVEQVAQQANVPTDQVYGAISSVLPQIIDSLTPDGDATDHQEANSDIQNVMNLVSGFLK
ncbi:YidB family protein [Acinetobacter gerneri]|uniref:YidB family protein n=1 Tax=Acinetobacter gerneri TaxID=202952 RepID=A0AAW8JJZ7_9GAMM|nr:YidB family protein [Acinetobacter gerneri]MDQ9010903.1 YidB family protein [Acinetobacter gerneri]MDQ9015039.1 YidB family protein [Acinetobacter gerneri]MDQ9026254.1 YidB family protein [Acinetobacter gerneri]MDQ9053535.1 YidB family protein [Acinetobacter gerneri]MDQ9061154.1 YidB family protein [Acinetobacter gerneri]